MRRVFTTIIAFSVGLAACSGAPTPSAAPATTAAVDTAIPGAVGPTETALPTAVVTRGPTQDFNSYLLTQAYALYTPQPGATEIVTTPTATATKAPGSTGGRAATAAPVAAEPAPLYISEPIQIANTVNSADCKIRDLGDCTKTMSAGQTLFFTFTFGYAADQKFTWGNAAVIVTRDGQQFSWSQVGNMLVKPPDFTKNENWSLKVGEQAKFVAGIENIQPGHYTARLAMCTAAPENCSAGQGWQNVGGDAIDFIIIP